MNDFRAADTIPDMKENLKVFQRIPSGQFDAYIDGFARQLQSLQAPVFLRFAHEFDNPAYPWSQAGENQPEDFIEAWRYVYDRFMAQGAFNVIWVWNPYTHENAQEYFPGEAYVDWIGVTALNYGSLNRDGQWHPFDEVYGYFDKAFENLPNLPVMLAEFGSLNLGGNRERWLTEALQVSGEKYKEIKAWVVFFSKWDRNIPPGTGYLETFLDWTGPLEPMHTLPRLGSGDGKSCPKTSEGPAGKRYTPLKMPEDPIRGVQYKKGRRWFSSHYILDRPTLEKDFDEMIAAGVNTIRIEDPGVYAHNVLRISRKKNLRLIYSLSIPDSLDFCKDRDALARLRDHILETVDRHKDQAHIVAWNLGNPVWNALRKSYARPALDGQRNAFLVWFEDLCRAIRERDPKRLLLVDLIASQGAEEFVLRVREAGIPVDAHGFIMRDTADLNYFRQMNQRQDIPYYIADARVEDLRLLSEPSVVIHSWQDQWEANQVTFDGLINHQGKRKRTYYTLAARWAELPEQDVPGSISILRPAIPLYPGEKVTYYAKRFEKGVWRDPTAAENEDYEWFLVKLGYFGEPIALKSMGTGSSLQLEIPKGYSFYRLMLAYQKKDTDQPAISVQKTLNLPLYALE